MDIDTVEVCWTILQQYVKSSDRNHAVIHLVGELLDNGFRDEDIERLKNIDSHFEEAVQEHITDNPPWVDEYDWDE